MSKVLASTRLSMATTVLVVGLVFAVAAAVSMVVLSRDGGAVEAAEGQPLGRVINLTTTEGGPGRYKTALTDVRDCSPATVMISITSDSPRARAQFVRAFASPDGTTEFVSDGHVLLPFFPPPPPGVPAPDDLTKVSGPFFSIGSPYVSLRVLVLEHDEFGIPGPPVLGATVDVSIWCVFGPGGASFPPAPGGPPR